MRGTGSKPWLEPGLGLDNGDELPSLSPRTSLEEVRLCPGVKPDIPARCAGRAEATESPRFRPAFACTLHLLLTLSDRFIMALSTNPPSPLVGEGGRPDVDRILEALPKPGLSIVNEVFRSNGLKDGKSRAGDFDGDNDTTDAGLADRGSSGFDSVVRPVGGAKADFGGDEGGVALSGSSFERSPAMLDMPGSLIARLVEAGAASASVSLLRYAAEPTPLSAV